MHSSRTIDVLPTTRVAATAPSHSRHHANTAPRTPVTDLAYAYTQTISEQLTNRRYRSQQAFPQQSQPKEPIKNPFRHLRSAQLRPTGVHVRERPRTTTTDRQSRLPYSLLIESAHISQTLWVSGRNTLPMWIGRKSHHMYFLSRFTILAVLGCKRWQIAPPPEICNQYRIAKVFIECNHCNALASIPPIGPRQIPPFTM